MTADAAATLRNPGTDADQVIRLAVSLGGRPMLVGGYVRDAILGMPSKDIDIEVYGLDSTDPLMAALEAGGFCVGIAGKQFSVLSAHRGSASFDISLPRLDSKMGSGHRGFEVTADPELSFEQATARRDFTINSLMWDPVEQRIIDCHGGVTDLADSILRHTSDAFADDPLRVLRGVQFAARFGFTMAPETAALCQRMMHAFWELPTERIWGEMEKIGTKGTYISAALRALRETGWEMFFPPLAGQRAIRQDPAWHPEGDVWTHSGLAADVAAGLAGMAALEGEDRLVIVFAALMHDFGKVTHTQVLDGRITSHGHAEAGVQPADDLMKIIGCPLHIRRRILPLIREHMSCLGMPTPSAVRRLARRLQPATMAELALVIGADNRGRGNIRALNPAAPWLEKAASLSVQERPRTGILTGRHLIGTGMKPGPAFRPLLEAALAAQDEGEFDDEAGALRWLAARE